MIEKTRDELFREITSHIQILENLLDRYSAFHGEVVDLHVHHSQFMGDIHTTHRIELTTSLNRP